MNVEGFALRVHGIGTRGEAHPGGRIPRSMGPYGRICPVMTGFRVQGNSSDHGAGFL